MSRIASARASAISTTSSRPPSMGRGVDLDENTPLLESANRTPAELMDDVDDQK